VANEESFYTQREGFVQCKVEKDHCFADLRTDHLSFSHNQAFPISLYLCFCSVNMRIPSDTVHHITDTIVASADRHWATTSAVSLILKDFTHAIVTAQTLSVTTTLLFHLLTPWTWTTTSSYLGPSLGSQTHP
jgi:hypothetical protein